MEKKKISRCKNIKLQPFHTFLVEQYIDITEQMKFSLLSGSAQILGLQLKFNYPHTYSVPCSIPIFTWEGAQINIEWIQYQGIKNSELEWRDITKQFAKSSNADYLNEQYVSPMVQYLQFAYKLIEYRKIALQSSKYGPVVAVIGQQDNAPQNISKLLLNYSGKFGMNPIFVDIDPEKSHIFIDGSVGALDFQYKILEDLFDRPDKICFYYGNRRPKQQSFMSLLSFLNDTIRKKLSKERKQFIEHGSSEQYPTFISGLIIQCPKIRLRNNIQDQFRLLNRIIELFQVTHIVGIDCQNYLQQTPNNNKIQKIKMRVLQGTQSFVGLPRPIKSRIERYFEGQSKRKTFPIDQITLYELMSKNQSDSMHCRKINIREEAISKNTVAILHARIQQDEQLSQYQIADRALHSPICYLLHIFNIGHDQITLDAPAQSIFQQYKNNIWVTSSTEQ